MNVSLKIFLTVRITPSEDFYEGGDLLHRLSEDTGRGQPIFALNYCNLHNSGFELFRKFNYSITDITLVDHYYGTRVMRLDQHSNGTITLDLGPPTAGAVTTVYRLDD